MNIFSRTSNLTLSRTPGYFFQSILHSTFFFKLWNATWLSNVVFSFEAGDLVCGICQQLLNCKNRLLEQTRLLSKPLSHLLLSWSQSTCFCLQKIVYWWKFKSWTFLTDRAKLWKYTDFSWKTNLPYSELLSAISLFKVSVGISFMLLKTYGFLATQTW